MKQYFHPYELWEDHKAGFYNNCSGKEKQEKTQLVIKMFNSCEETKDNMLRVIDEWVCSCEHNLSNPNMNKIAYIGQAACCIYGAVPNTVTMEAWSLLDKNVQERSDKIALEVLEIWEKKYNLKQLCLNLD